MKMSQKMRFQHFILTRFNERLYGSGRKNKYGQKIIPNEWVEYRLEIFRKYCLPSLASQTNQNFQWIFLCDPRTPPHHRSVIEGFRSYPNLIPVFEGSYKDAIWEHLGKETEYLITTRIDSDDAFHRRYVQRIQEEFDGQEREFLNFPNGYSLSKETLYPVRLMSNAFASLVEKPDRSKGPAGFLTVRCGMHDQLCLYGPIRQVEESPMWLIVVHEQNLLTVEESCDPVPMIDLAQEFGVKNR